MWTTFHSHCNCILLCARNVIIILLRSLVSNLEGLVGILEVVGVGAVQLEEGSKIAEGLSEAPLTHAGEQLQIDREDSFHIGEDGVSSITGQQAPHTNGLQEHLGGEEGALGSVKYHTVKRVLHSRSLTFRPFPLQRLDFMQYAASNQRLEVGNEATIQRI